MVPVLYDTQCVRFYPLFCRPFFRSEMIIIRTKEFGSVLDEKILLEVSDFEHCCGALPSSVITKLL